MICENCNTEFEGKFCSECGQKKIHGRFTIHEIIHNFFHSFTHFDSGVLYLIKELFLRPGIVVKEYISGKRKKYFNPFQLLIIVTAISAFLAVKFYLFGDSNVDRLTDIETPNKFWIQFNDFIFKYYSIVIFVSIPIGAFYTRFIFKKSGYNYAENLIFHTSFLPKELSFS